MPVACVCCRAGTDIMSAAIMSADIMFLLDVLAWQARSAFYLYEVIKMLKIQCVYSQSERVTQSTPVHSTTSCLILFQRLFEDHIVETLDQNL